MKIAVSAWSFHTPIYAGKLRQEDVPAEVAALGFRQVELLEMFLWRRPPGILQRVWRRSPISLARKEAGDEGQPAIDYGRETLSELRTARLRAGTQLACWAVDTDLTLAGTDARRAQLAHIGTAIEAARFLGASVLRITTGGQAGDTDGLGRVVDALRSVLPAAMLGGVKLAIENHFGLSANPQALVEIVTALKSPHVGVCLDLGHFDGEESRIDYGSALSILRAVGYDGVLSIEFEGDGPPADGIRKTKALIAKYWK
jgi:sugar phosphate isomerase/epimerase